MNSTWLITSELANQHARKALFACVVYTNFGYYIKLDRKINIFNFLLIFGACKPLSRNPGFSVSGFGNARFLKRRLTQLSFQQVCKKYQRITLHIFLYLVPTEPPNDIDANILETIVEISWGEVPEESRNGEIRGYRVTYYKANNKTYKKTVTNPPDFFTVQLKSLGKFSEYYVEILAYTNAGNGKVGNISFKTSDDSKYQY